MDPERERELDQWQEWANDIEPDMSDWEAACTAWRAQEAERELLGVQASEIEECGAVTTRWMRLLKILERWAGTLVLVAMGAAAADSFRKGEIIAGLLGVLFLVTLIAIWQRAKRLLQLGDDQALVQYLPQDIRACRVEQQGEELVFRDLGTQALLLPLRMGDLYYLADPEWMPQYRNRSDDNGESAG
jgi:hypothetical protein